MGLDLLSLRGSFARRCHWAGCPGGIRRRSRENHNKEIMMKKLSVAIVVVMAFMGVLLIGCNTKQAEQKPAEQ